MYDKSVANSLDDNDVFQESEADSLDDDDVFEESEEDEDDADAHPHVEGRDVGDPGGVLPGSEGQLKDRKRHRK